MTRGTTRRAVVRGIAWTTPVIVAAAATPALATSGCPSFSAKGTFTATGGGIQAFQRITLTNVGPTSDTILAAGTTITWTIVNTSGASRAYTVSSLTGLAATITSATVAAGASVTFTFTLDANWLPGTTVGWTLSVGSSDVHPWTYKSTIKVTTSTCPPGRYVCLSSFETAFDATCPP